MKKRTFLVVLVLFLIVTHAALCAEPEYIYKTVKVWPEDVSKTVQNMGRQGWELVSQTKLGTVERKNKYTYFRYNENRIHYELVFRKPVPPDTIVDKIKGLFRKQ